MPEHQKEVLGTKGFTEECLDFSCMSARITVNNFIAALYVKNVTTCYWFDKLPCSGMHYIHLHIYICTKFATKFVTTRRKRR